MKKLIAVAGLGAAITLGSLVGAGTANADSGSFLGSLDNAGFYNTNGGHSAELRLGYGICQNLYGGWSYNEVVNDLYYGSPMSWSDARQFVSIANGHLC